MDDKKWTKIFVKRDNRLIVLTSPLSLEAMASIRVVLNIWDHRCMCAFLNEPSNMWKSRKRRYLHDYIEEADEEIPYFDVGKLTETGQVPLVLKKALTVQAIRIRDRLSDWYPFYLRVLRRHSVADLVEDIIWNCDGEINYLETAQRLLTSSKLDKIEKCRLMFTFCLKNQIETLSPALYDETCFPEISSPQDMENQRNPMLGYWKYFLDGTIAKVNLQYVTSAESFFLNMAGVSNVHAIEYFCSCLKDDDEWMEAATAVIRNYDIQSALFVLPRLKQAQQDQILRGGDGTLLLMQLTDFGYLELVKSLWMHMGNILEEKRFSNLMNYFIYFANELSTSNTFLDIFTFVWTNAPDRLKRFVLNSDSRCLTSFIKNSCHWCDTYSTLEFLTNTFKHVRTEIKSAIVWCDEFLEFYSKMVSVGRVPAAAERIIKLCLPENDQVIKFKRRMMDTRSTKSHCALLRRTGKLDELKEFLHYFEQDENNINIYMAEFLES